jgi:poly-D-alanine transfer protein DltD
VVGDRVVVGDIRERQQARAIYEQAKQNEAELISRFGTADGSQVKGGANQLEFNRVVDQQKEEDKRAQQDAAREFKKTGPTEEESSNAADQLLQERLATAAKQAGFNDSLTEALTKMAQKEKETQQDLDAVKAQVQAITAAISLKGQTGNGNMPGRNQRVRAATV